MELAGYDVPPVRTERRSVSHARVLAGTEKRDARAVFRGLVVLAAHRLRRMGLAARVLEGWADETAFRVKVSPPSASEQTLLRVAALAWDGRVRPGPKGKVGVFLHVARDGPSHGLQASLDGEAPAPPAAPLDGVLDALRERYGLPCVRFGRTRWGAWPGQKISFSRVPGAFGQI